MRRYKWAHTSTLEQVKHAQGRACVIQPGRACVSLCAEAKGHSRAIFFSSFYKALGDRIGGEKDGGLKEAKGGKIVIMLTQLTVRCAAVKLFTQQISGRAWPAGEERAGGWVGGDPARILLCKPTLGYSTLLHSMKNTHTLHRKLFNNDKTKGSGYTTATQCNDWLSKDYAALGSICTASSHRTSTTT